MTLLPLLQGILLGAVVTAAAGMATVRAALRMVAQKRAEVRELEAALANMHRMCDHLINHGEPAKARRNGVYR